VYVPLPPFDFDTIERIFNHTAYLIILGFWLYRHVKRENKTRRMSLQDQPFRQHVSQLLGIRFKRNQAVLIPGNAKKQRSREVRWNFSLLLRWSAERRCWEGHRCSLHRLS
jgi:hypothetical protein